MTGCRLTTPGADDSSQDNSLSMDETSSSDTSIEDNDDSLADSSNGSLGQADDLPWKSPMADYVPDSPYSSYISFANGEISTFEDSEFFSDYISGDYKYTCCDLSGDGVPELVLLYSDGEEERLLTFGYDREANVLFKSFEDGFCSETDYISKNGFVVLNYYKDISGEYYLGKTDDDSYTQFIQVRLAQKGTNDYGNDYITWEKEAGNSEFEESHNRVFEADYDHIMEMAEDQVTLSDGKNPEDMIPYLEECEEEFEDSYKEYKLSKQHGEGLFCNFNILDVPDNEYEDEDSAYEAFINNETCVRCECGIGTLDANFPYIYGDKFTLSNWYNPEESETMEKSYIDCGSDGTKELVIEIAPEAMEPNTIYVISFYEGHLYLKFVVDSWSRSSKEIGEDGYINSYGSSSAWNYSHDEAVLDSNVIYHEIYDLVVVTAEGNKEYFPEAFEISGAGEGSTIYIYEIDGKEYYVPYGWDEPADEEDYTDFMNACIECGISFSTQEEVDALIEEKKAEYGF
ncbi:MAG: hypothetical protein K6G87_04620 [Butyrivibrio sp.]|uniref:hypothetical protein n=1 Tax=Butyrivibrio sp. TaxID=28121 RepID=UPI0025DB64C5|nr:hypothetical protein [Butyrivibrio sp.]MCR5770503.1 hypothetical protein [Butyrivibrio sp.]